MTINLRSGKESGKIQLILTIFLSIVLAIFIVATLPQINLENVTSSFMPKGIIGIFEATALLFVAYIGFEAIATVGGEIENPEKVIPLASFISVALCSLIYVLVGFASLGVVNWTVLKESMTPLALVAQATLGRYGEYLVIIGGVVATLTTLNASLLASTRVLYAMSRDGYLPEALHKIHPRYITPFNAIIASSLFIMLFAATGMMKFVVGAANFGFLLGLALTNLSVIFLRKKGLKRPFETPYYPYMPILGFLTCLTMALFLEKEVLIGGVVVIAVGVLVYIVTVMKRVIEEIFQAF